MTGQAAEAAGRPPVLAVQGLSKRYGPRKALEEVSFELARGEALGVVGRSGAGKSTLIRCIVGLERPESGSIRLQGQEVNRLRGRALRAARRKVGMVFQHFNLLASRTALGNVLLPLELAGVRRAEAEARARNLLARVGLRGWEEAYPAQLSGGQKQRVGIARALALTPSLLLCDEPTSALDPATATSILRLLDEIRQEYGVSILLVSHDLSAVRAVCSRLVVLESGRVVESGPAERLLRQPLSVAARQLLAAVPAAVPGPAEAGAGDA
ncbi:MAG: ATP-binding cassette domain-containing protein [Bacillota bacterium]|nr:ATP-binding cassette domain-containing protein [Bacillota bacterium]